MQVQDRAVVQKAEVEAVIKVEHLALAAIVSV